MAKYKSQSVTQSILERTGDNSVLYIIKKTRYSLTILGDKKLLVRVKIGLLLGSLSRSPADA